MSKENPKDLEDVLDEIGDVANGGGEVSIDDIQDAVGKRAFAPFLLIGGLIVLSPLGGIPGVPTIFAVIVLLTAGQMLLGRSSFWLPDIITRRSVEADKLAEALDKMRKPANWVDQLLRPRLRILTEGMASYGVALACVALAVMMPPLEAVPFAVAAPAAAITLFSLSLVANDGLLALLGYIATAGSIYVVTNYIIL